MAGAGGIWRRLLRRVGAMRDRLWFQWFRTYRAFALFIAGFVALFGDLVGPFQSVLPRSVRWWAAISNHYGMTLLQFVLGVVSVWTVIQLAWRAVRLRRAETMELRPADASGDAWVKGIKGRTDPVVIVRGVNGVVALNAAVDAALDQASNPIRRVKRPYNLPMNLAPWRPLATPHINPWTVNEAKVGLRTEIDAAFVAGGAPVVLQDTDYLLDRCSNGVVVQQVWDRERDEPAWNGRPCFVSDDGFLLPLDSAFASNQLGGSTLLIDMSWNIHLTRQTSKAAESAGLLAPTGSGSFDLRRLRQARSRRRSVDFQAFARSEIERELREETGLEIRRDEIVTILIGFGRYLYRGGKPEIFAVSGLRRSTAEMRVRPGEDLWTAGHAQHPWRDLETSDAGLGGQMSAPLAANLHLLRAFLASPASADFRRFLAP